MSIFGDFREVANSAKIKPTRKIPDIRYEAIVRIKHDSTMNILLELLWCAHDKYFMQSVSVIPVYRIVGYISAGINFCDLATELTELISADFISAVEGQREIISADPISGLSKVTLIASNPE